MVMIMVYVAIVRKFVNQDLTRILGFFFSNRVMDTRESGAKPQSKLNLVHFSLKI